MKPFLTFVLGLLLGAAIAPGAESTQGISLVPVHSLTPQAITGTGRVQSLIAARIGPRVSGHLREFGKNEAGKMLDAGMPVKAGQLLFQLNTTTFENTLAMAEAGLRSAEANLKNLTARTREERLEQLRNAVAELDVRLADRKREEERYRRLVEQEKTMPPRRLEEVLTDVASITALRAVAQARLREAENGPTPTEVAVAQARIDEARVAVKAAQDDLRDTTIKAPFDGVIVRRFKSVGDYLVNMPPTEVLELVSFDTLEVELKLPEAYLASVSPETTRVTLRSPLLKSEIQTPVSRIIPEVDPATGTFAIRVAVSAAQRGGLVPGAFVTATIPIAGQGQGLIIPLRAVLLHEGKTVVFVVENNRMRRQPIELGDRLTEGVVVRAGLSAGQQVVVGPASALKDGAELPVELRQPAGK